jgi:hypothetical protein
MEKNINRLEKSKMVIKEEMNRKFKPGYLLLIKIKRTNGERGVK